MDCSVVCTRLPFSPSCSITAEGLHPELSSVYDDAGACFAGWNQPRLSASSSRFILTSVPETDRCTGCGKIVRRASSRGRSSQTSGYLCIIKLTQLPVAERSILTPLPFVWRRAFLQRSSSHKGVFVPASAADMGCCATVDIKACSLSVDTSLYHVTLLGRSYLVTHELLHRLTSDMSVRSCLLIRRFSWSASETAMVPRMQSNSIFRAIGMPLSTSAVLASLRVVLRTCFCHKLLMRHLRLVR